MNINLARSRQLTGQIDVAAAQGQNAARGAAGAPSGRGIDDRFDPRQALAATVRYLKIAEQHFGRRDLAFESYHMGIGNLQNRARRLRRRRARARTSQLYFDTAPDHHAARVRPARELRRRLLALLLAPARRRAGHAPVPDRSCGSGSPDLRSRPTTTRTPTSCTRPTPWTRSRTPDALDAGLRGSGRSCRCPRTRRALGLGYDPGIGSLARAAARSRPRSTAACARRPSIC